MSQHEISVYCKHCANKETMDKDTVIWGLTRYMVWRCPVCQTDNPLPKVGDNEIDSGEENS